MRRTLIRLVRVLAVATLLFGQGLSAGSGDVLALESLRQVTDTTDGFYYTYPSVSVDGARIAFWSPGQQAIFIANADGAGFHPVLDPASFQALGPPSMSGDGSLIVFSGRYLVPSSRTCSCGDIFLVATQGGLVRQLTPALTGDPEIDQFIIGSRGNPVISGDETTVVFASNSNFTRQNGDGSEELFVVKTDGSGLRQLTSTTNVSAPNIGDILISQAAFSPAVDYLGARVAFLLSDDRIRRVEGGGERVSFDISLYLVNADGSGQRKLTPVSDNYTLQEILGERPAISGDGNTVAFPAFLKLGDGNPDGSLEMFSIKADGAGLRQLTSTTGRSTFPALSYDGSRLAFSQIDPGVFERRAYEVYIVKTDGTGLTQLTTTPGDPTTRRSGFEGVDISADGTHVVFSSSGDLLGQNSDGNYEIFTRQFTSVIPVQGVRNPPVVADLQNNRFSLVARRDLVMRAFFDTGAGGGAAPASGRLVVDEGTPTQAVFDVNTYTAQPLGYFDGKPGARKRLEDSLNFFITGARADDLLVPGAHTFKVTVQPQGGGFAPWEESFSATFREADTVDIFIVPVNVRNAAGGLVSPDAAVQQTASDFFRATYPVDENAGKVRNIVMAAVEVAQPPDTDLRQLELAKLVARTLNEQLAAGVVPNPARRNFAAGLVPSLVDGQGSLGGFLGNDGVTQLATFGYTFPAIRGVVVSLDREPSAAGNPLVGSTIAHEIGHTFGLGDEYTGGDFSLNNPPPGGSPVEGDTTGNYVREIARGLDTGKRTAVFSRAGSEAYGYMGGGHDLNSWATGIDYSFIYPQIVTNTVGGSQVSAAAATRFINVSGVITRTGGIALDPFIVATSPYTFTRPSGSQYAFQFRDSGGALLDAVNFDVEFLIEVRGVGTRPSLAAPFSFTVPLPEGVSSLAVVSGTTTLAVRTVSPSLPVVSLLSPTGGEDLRGAALVRWQASDPDGDNLSYTLFYSPNGRDRYVVATDVRDTTREVDFGRLPTGDRASMIIRASDGFNYAEATSGPFAAGRRQVFAPLVLRNSEAGW